MFVFLPLPLSLSFFFFDPLLFLLNDGNFKK